MPLLWPNFGGSLGGSGGGGGGGTFEVIADLTASASASHVVALTGYEQVEILAIGVQIDTSADIYLWLSADGGTTKRNAADDYHVAHHSSSTTGNASASRVLLSSSAGTGPHWGFARLNHIQLAKEKSFQAVAGRSGARTLMHLSTDQEVINALVIEPSAGAFSAGRFLVFGRPE